MTDADIENITEGDEAAIEEEENNGIEIPFTVLDEIKGKYASVLLKFSPQPLKIMVPKGEGPSVEGDVSEITVIPPIIEKQLSEVELNEITKGYTYVRILYDNISNEYMYQVIEPKLSEDETTLLEVLKEALVATVTIVDSDDEEERKEYLRDATSEIMRRLDISVHPVVKERIMYYIFRDFIGFGVIDVMMIDPDVEDLSCDGVDIPFYIYHRRYGSIQSNMRFSDEHKLDSFVVWMAQRSGKHISVAEPVLDATLPDGSRLNETLGKHVTKRGSSFTIRRFKENPFTPLDLLRFKTMSTEMMVYLWVAIEGGQSTLVCGGTASGKTTTLNAILLFIPPQMKIVSIEDTRELNLPHENWIPSLTRSGFGGKNIVTGKAAGEVDMFDLLTAALRQRPQYLMVGEVRGAEAYVVFQAMATGKTAYTTFHAEDVASMVHRMENEPINLPRALLAALDIVLMQAQVKVGTKMTRRVKSLTEIVGLDPETDELITNSVFVWNPADDTFNYSGHSYVYEKVRIARNWSPREMDREIKRRVDILNYMKQIGVKNHREVSKIIADYYKNPDMVMKNVREVLYGEAGEEKRR